MAGRCGAVGKDQLWGPSFFLKQEGAPQVETGKRCNHNRASKNNRRSTENCACESVSMCVTVQVCESVNVCVRVQVCER